nr:hypothetical protein [Tanacetum cinerariifolium]
MNRLDDDLFRYEVENSRITNIPCDSNKEDDSEQQMSHETDDDIKYDPSDVEFTEWLASKLLTTRGWIIIQIKYYGFTGLEEMMKLSSWTKNPLIHMEKMKLLKYLGSGLMCLTSRHLFGFKTYDDYKDDWIYEWNKKVPWVHEKPWADTGVWTEPTPVKHCYKPFNYKNGCSEWPTCSWRDDGYCNRGNLLGAYIVGNTLRMIDYNDESSNQGWRRWDNYEITNHDNEYENEHGDEKRHELCDDATQELPVCTIRRFEMIKYSFEQDKDYVAVKEGEYEDLMSTSKDECRAYQEIFCMMEEGWMELAAKKLTK